MKVDIANLADRQAVVTLPLATDALLHLFTTPHDTSKLDEVWGAILAPESDKKG